MTNIPTGIDNKQRYIALYLGSSDTYINLSKNGKKKEIHTDDIIVLGFPRGNTIKEVMQDYTEHLHKYHFSTDIPLLIEDTVLYPINNAVYVHKHLLNGLD